MLALSGALLVLVVLGVLLLAAVVWLVVAALGWLGIDSTTLRDLVRDNLGTWVSSWFKGAGGGG